MTPAAIRDIAIDRAWFSPDECYLGCDDHECPYSHQSNWFATIGGEHVGPFDSEDEANAAVLRSAIDRAEQAFREALDTSAATCARARDAAEEARRQADRIAVNERRLAIARAHDQFSLAAERRTLAVPSIEDFERILREGV